uniref:Uncharacterized protein n=1 Tax=Lepeophtheirus salmonis TaxID=72036 RepID=A0A0K2TUV8_LEPSM
MTLIFSNKSKLSVLTS